MTDIKNKIKNTKDKIAGETKEAVGKATGNEELEFKGKIQSIKADIRGKIEDIKENTVKEINDKLDEKDQE